MNFIKIKDDYINLDSVTEINVSEHEVMFVFPGSDDGVSIGYRDDKQEPTYGERQLTTEALQQLKDRIEYAVLNNQPDC